MDLLAAVLGWSTYTSWQYGGRGVQQKLMGHAGSKAGTSNKNESGFINGKEGSRHLGVCLTSMSMMC